MGGPGSGRIGWRSVVEDSLSLDIGHLGREKYTSPGQIINGNISWSFPNSISRIGFTTDAADLDDPKITLEYSITAPTGEKTDFRYTLPLEYSYPHFGGKRWWARCGLALNWHACNRRVKRLYLPLGGKYFACRHCYKLIYRSSLESHQMDRLLRLIGLDAGLTFRETKEWAKRWKS